jgi:hypothetical protein
VDTFFSTAAMAWDVALNLFDELLSHADEQGHLILLSDLPGVHVPLVGQLHYARLHASRHPRALILLLLVFPPARCCLRRLIAFAFCHFSLRFGFEPGSYLLLRLID